MTENIHVNSNWSYKQTIFMVNLKVCFPPLTDRTRLDRKKIVLDYAIFSTVKTSSLNISYQKNDVILELSKGSEVKKSSKP